MTADRTPGPADADIILTLYDLRREDVMRASRDTISFGFWPRSWDEVQAVMDFEHEDNAAFRQVTSYWEMAYGFGRRGLVDGESLVEANGEGLLLWVKLRPFLETLRAMSPTALQSIEWAATRTEAGRQRVAFFETRFAEKLALAAPA